MAGRYTDPDNRRLANRTIKHRDHLFTFLHHDDVETTDNAAERAPRPAVIARKLSAGNRSPTGSDTHAVLAGLAQTVPQNGQNFVRAAKALPAVAVRTTSHTYYHNSSPDNELVT